MLDILAKVTAFIFSEVERVRNWMWKDTVREQEMSGREWERFDVEDKGRGCG